MDDQNEINIKLQNNEERFRLDLEQPVLLRLPEEEANYKWRASAQALAYLALFALFLSSLVAPLFS